MQSDEARKFLGQAYYIDRGIAMKRKRLEAMNASSPVPGVRYTDEPMAHGSGAGSVTENLAVRRMTLEDEIRADIKHLEGVLRMIESSIRAIESVECRTVLEMRYLCFMDWKEIASAMDLSMRSVFYIHGRALRQVHVPDDGAMCS